MGDIEIYADRMAVDFETLLECITSCDEKVFEHAKATRRPGRRDVGANVQPAREQ